MDGLLSLANSAMSPIFIIFAPMKKHQLLPILFIVVFAAACYFPLFLHLDHMSVRLWDEARRAVNAFEMAKSGNFLVTHYEGQPEMWGTKPPFLIWCEAISMRLFGYNEIALRLPSALAALSTIIVLVLFSWKVLKKPLVGFLAALVLVTTKGYVGAHVARSGDFDSLLTLWETCYLLSFFVFCSKRAATERKKWLLTTAGFIALAGITKGIAGFLFIPGLAIFAAISGVGGDAERRPVFSLFTEKTFWMAAALAFAPLISFYLLREAYNPGYLAAVMGNEVGGRYLETKGGHNHPWYHYVQWLFKEQFMPWLMFLPLGLVVGFWEQGKMRRITALLLLNAIIFLLVISCSKTKIMWYMAPVYPSLALLVGIAFEKLVTVASPISKYKYAILAAFVVGMYWQPYQFIIDRVYMEQHPSWDWPELKYRNFMRQCKEQKAYTIVHKKYNSHVVFYRNVFNQKGYKIKNQPLIDFELNKYEFGKPPLDFQPGNMLMVCEKDVFKALDTVYQYRVSKEWDGCKMLTITGRLNDSGQ
ncbi:MAG: phospholipid carrier-dependent glycosyltransferase [Bacteroidetes bacterium]|nr:phospholipid carrier-dependent glycosyltransferase [Bacteroidota bacterium]